MKKHYLIGALIAATALVAAAQAATSLGLPQHRKAVAISDFPTHPAIGDGQFAEGWTVINANEDDFTWEAKESGGSSYASSGYTYSGKGNMDDYLMSPGVSMEGGNQYTISFEYRMGFYGSSFKDNLSLYISESNDIQDLTEADEILRIEDAYISDYESKSVSFTPSTSGDYYLFFYCFSEENKSGVEIRTVAIIDETASASAAPATVSLLDVTPDATRAVECTLTWVLPTMKIKKKVVLWFLILIFQGVLLAVRLWSLR